MSGQDEEIWSKEPPSETGWYWYQTPQETTEPCYVSNSGEIYLCGSGEVWNAARFRMHQMRFGPRLPSLLALTAAEKRVEELKGARDAAEQSEQAMAAKLKSLLDGGHGETCGCSYDRPDDVCMHHSPQLAALTSQLAAMKAVADDARRLAELVYAYHAYDTEVPASKAKEVFEKYGHHKSHGHTELMTKLARELAATTNGEGER